MFISKVEIKKSIKIKIFEKHGVKKKEVEHILLHEHIAFKSKRKRYVAIGNYTRYITIIYEMHKNTAFVITAYKTTKSQLRRYKKWLSHSRI